MSQFQGYNITGIDRDLYPVVRDDTTTGPEVDYDIFYLDLEPIGERPDWDSQLIWGASFEAEVRLLDKDELLEKRFIEIPRIRFFSSTSYAPRIYTSGVSLKPLNNAIPEIKQVVKQANEMFIKTIDGIIRDREEIDRINSSHFRN